MPKIKKIELNLEYQNYIQTPPVAGETLWNTACSGDGPTLKKFSDVWVNNAKVNHAKFGSFKDKGVGLLFNLYKHRPVIVAGAGPSLKRNGEELKDRDGIGLVSCLHNFHYFVDRDIPVDFFVSLDAGEVTIEEVSEGGSKTPEEYWEATKDHTLLAYVGSSPRLLEKWRGKIYFFNAPVPGGVDNQIDELEVFRTYVSSGGNVLGACVYLAKAIFGGNPIAFVGADFCFSYEKKFHGWDSKYDATIGNVQRTVDVFGNKVFTWPSYFGFKCFFDWMAQNVPGIYINCTEGGTLGAYPDGNIMAIPQMDVSEFIGMYRLSEKVKDSCLNPDKATKIILY